MVRDRAILSEILIHRVVQQYSVPRGKNVILDFSGKRKERYFFPCNARRKIYTAAVVLLYVLLHNCAISIDSYSPVNKFDSFIIFYPTTLKGCRGIVFTHGVRMGGRVGGRREIVCPGCISETVRCRKFILGRDIG